MSAEPTRAETMTTTLKTLLCALAVGASGATTASAGETTPGFLEARPIVRDGQVLSTAVPVGDWSAATRRAMTTAAASGHSGAFGQPGDESGVQAVFAGPLPICNGGFSSGLDHWTVTESGGSGAPGDVTVEGGRAVFREGDSFLVSLEQTFTLPEGMAALEFDLFVDPGFDTLDMFLPDAWEVSLLDDGGFPAVDPWDAFASSYFNLQEDGTANLGPSASWDGDTVTLDVSGLPADQDYTVVFVMLGADGDTASALGLDDVALTIECGIEGEANSYGAGWPGTGGVVPQLTLVGAPAMCQQSTLLMDNTTGADVPAFVFAGLAPADVPTPYGGSLLVEPFLILDFVLDDGGRIVPLDMPCDPMLCGEAIYLQLISQDPGASAGWAFTPGLEVVFGDDAD
jgi:hypothetical protein